MRPLDEWRREIAAALPGGFLRRDREEKFLFAADYPRRCSDAGEVSRRLEGMGYVVVIEAGLAHLDALPEKYAALTEKLPEPAAVLPREDTLPLILLARRIRRAGASDFSRVCGRKEGCGLTAFDVTRRVIKCLDAGEGETLPLLLPPMLAQLQRQGIAPPREAAKWIEWDLANR